jgi:hypothetical protein
MNPSALSGAEMAFLIALVAIAIACIAALFFYEKRRSERLRAHFGGDEYTRTVQKWGNRRKAEAALEERTKRVEALHVRPLSPDDRARFVESWLRVQARFVDGPAQAVAEADRLLGEVMSTQGYPVSDFEQRAADLSVAHPNVLKNYRTAHEIAVREKAGQATTEELRQAMVHYRFLFEELAGEPEISLTKAAQ